MAAGGKIECPICFELRDDVEILRHKGSKELGRTDSGRNVSEHKVSLERSERAPQPVIGDHKKSPD